jgi:hypothetical protein
MAEMTEFSAVFPSLSCPFCYTGYVHDMYIIEVGMGTYCVPEEIRAMKPKGTIVKRLRISTMCIRTRRARTGRQANEDGSREADRENHPGCGILPQC